MTEQDTKQSSVRRGVRCVSVEEAATMLGVSKDAVRMRIRRGTLRAERVEGRVYVWLDEDVNADLHADQYSITLQAEADALLTLLREKAERLQELREQVHYFRQILAEERDARRRADIIIAQLTEANATLAARGRQLEAASREPSGSPTDSPEHGDIIR